MKCKTNPEPQLAHLNRAFLESDAGREVRILSEFLAPETTLDNQDIRNTIVFFGSARMLSTAEIRKRRKTSANDPQVLEKLDRLSNVAKYYDAAHELSKRLGKWANERREGYAICTGGGPGIMEAGNRGADDVGTPSIGFNIKLPFEQHPNPYISPELNMQFRYFFIRKFWFLFRARALVVFPGGFGTLDEMFETFTLIQTHKLYQVMPVVLYGPEYWNKLINWNFLVETGMIDKNDLKLFRLSDSVENAYKYITDFIEKAGKKVGESAIHTAFSSLR